MSSPTSNQDGPIHKGHPVRVDRYTRGARINHWITAISLILLAISGLSLYVPSLFFLTALFGGGQWTRAIHPWIGVILFFSFAGMFLRFWKLNFFRPEDFTWMMRMRDVMSGNEEKLPELGKYNAGQKVVFWSMSFLISVLIITGLIAWDHYFYAFTTIEQKRIAILIHSFAAIITICVWVVHVYAAIWVRGTMDAMTKGQVTGGWAWRHHRKWLRDLASGRKKTANTQGS